MDAARQQRRGGSIHEAVPFQRLQAGEAAGDDPHREMAALAGSGMAGMGSTVVAQGELLRSECPPQQGLELCGYRVHVLSLPRRYSHSICAARNSTIEPKMSGILVSTHTSSETV